MRTRPGLVYPFYVRIPVEFDTEAQLLLSYDSCLSKGFVVLSREVDLEVGAGCVITLIHPMNGMMLSLPARVSARDLPEGIELRIEEFGPEIDARIRSFVGVEVEVEVEVESFDESEEAGDDPHRIRPKTPANVQERLRHLTTNEMFRLARTGNLTERVALERIYGKAVWEPLVQNRGLTPPEVARIAHMGTLPGPLIDAIVANSSWLSRSLVRRALLSNPRLAGRALDKVLRALPKAELKLVPHQSAYSYKVRNAAKRLLGQ